jgi:hypothetical protein
MTEKSNQDITPQEPTPPKKERERMSFRSEEPPLFVRIVEMVGDAFLFLALGTIFSCVVLWEWMRNQIRYMQIGLAVWWGSWRTPQKDGGKEEPPETLVHPVPEWLRGARARKQWVDSTLKHANPGTLISCHNCPFRIVEANQSQRELAIPHDVWSDSIAERQAIAAATSRYNDLQRLSLPVCGHPANGVWGEARYGAHTPDEQSCPRALLAKMNPIRRAWWKWKMKRHLRQHANTPTSIR